MIETTPETDTAAAVLAAARETRGEHRPRRGPAAGAGGGLGGHAQRGLDPRGRDPGGRAYGEAGMPVAGEGAPLVAEFSVTEFAAALGLSTDAGKRYVGHALELRYRLPRVWRRVHGRRSAAVAGAADRREDPPPHPGRGGVCGPARRADRAPDRTRSSWTGWSTRRSAAYMPEEAEAPPPRARGRPVLHRRVPPAALLRRHPAVHGELDLADAMELEAAIQTVAAQLKDLGSDRVPRRPPLAGGRRAGQPSAVVRPRPQDGRPVQTRHHPRKIVLYVHLSEDALDRPPRTGQPPDHPRPAPRPVRRRQPGGRETGPRPHRPRPRRHSGGAGPAPRARRGPRPDLRVPLVHPARPVLRRRPHRPLVAGRSDVSVQRGLTLPTTSPGQDVHRLDLHGPRRRHLPLVEPARLQLPARHAPAPDDTTPP